jgi:hypothetical protein
MAMSWQHHGDIMATHMATAWQTHGNIMATTIVTMCKTVAKTLHTMRCWCLHESALASAARPTVTQVKARLPAAATARRSSSSTVFIVSEAIKQSAAHEIPSPANSGGAPL